MSKRMNILIAVAVFLAFATATFVITTVFFAFRCNTLHGKLDALEEHETQLVEDKKQLIQDKLALTAKVEEMYTDNADLAAAVKEFRELNEQLIEMNKQLLSEAEITGSEEEPAGFLPPAGIPTNTYRCEDYSGFSRNSEQAILQEDCFTDMETGIRYYLDTDGSR